MGLDNPLTAKEKLQVARITRNCGGVLDDDLAYVAWAALQLDYTDGDQPHVCASSMLLDGLSVHEVTMAECDLDDEAATEEWYNDLEVSPMTDPRPASERAADLRARILAVVEAGKFHLVRPGGFENSDEHCGCAVEAAASAMGCTANSPADMYRRYRSGLVESGIATRDERDELEAGFEWFAALDEGPFYALGVELRSLAEKAAP